MGTERLHSFVKAWVAQCTDAARWRVVRVARWKWTTSLTGRDLHHCPRLLSRVEHDRGDGRGKGDGVSGAVVGCERGVREFDDVLSAVGECLL